MSQPATWQNALKYCAGAAVALAIVAGFASWTFSASSLRGELADQLARETGLQLTSGGRITFALLPVPRIKIENISVRNRTGSLIIDAQVLQGVVRPLALVGGRIELVSATLFAPTIFADLNDNSLHAASAKGTGPAQRRSFVSLTLVAGLARLRLPGGLAETMVQDINVSAGWPGPDAPAGLNGQATWRGQTGTVNLQLANPPLLLAGQASGLKLDIKSAGLSLALDGRAAAKPGWQFEGRLSAASPALRDALRPGNIHFLAGAPLRDFSLAGDVQINAPGLSISSARLGLDGNSYEGALAWSTPGDGAPMLSATLASGALNLDAFFSEAPALRAPDGQWNAEAFQSGGLRDASLDLRMSAARASLRGLQAQDVAISLMLKNNRLEASLNDARGWSGKLKGRVSAIFNEAVELKGTLAFSQIDTSALSAAVFGDARLTGTASGQAAFEAHGETFQQLARSLGGEAQAALSRGDIAGFNAGLALRGDDSKSQREALYAAAGRTAFETANVAARAAGGTIWLTNADLTGPGAIVSVKGRFDVPRQNLDVKFTASAPANTELAAARAAPVQFGVSGSWSQLRIEMDSPAQ